MTPPSAASSILAPYMATVLNQDFHFGFLVLCKRISKPVARDVLLTNLNSGQPAVRVERHPCRPGKPKPGTGPSDFSAHLSVPPPFFAKILICQPPNSTPPVLAAHRSAAPCFRIVAASDGSRPAATSNTARALTNRPPVFTNRC